MRASGSALSLTFDELEVNCSTTSVVLDVEKSDADRVTFDDVISGLDWVWYFVVTGLPDYGPGTFWSLLWETPAFTPIPFLFAPYNNSSPTPEQPHFSGFVTIDQRPPLGGDAGARWTFGTRLTCTQQPVRVTEAPA